MSDIESNKVEQPRGVIELYQESQKRIEAVQAWKAGMFDKIRTDSLRRVSQIREAYMVDELEAYFRGIAKTVVKSKEGIKCADIVEYIIEPKGVEVHFMSCDVKCKNLITWEIIDEQIKKESKASLEGEELGS